MSSVRTTFYPWAGTAESSVRKVLVIAAQLSYALLICAGQFKGNEIFAWIPFDLTVAAACATLALSAICFLVTGLKLRIEAGWMLLFFIAMAISLLWTDWTAYGFEKALRFFTFQLMIALLPAVIFTDLTGVKRLAKSLIVIGMIASSGVLIQIVHGGFNGGIAERTAGLVTVTGTLGRYAGMSLVGLYAGGQRGGRNSWQALLCIPLFLALVASGSRGPLFLTVGMIALLSFCFSLPKIRTLAITLVLVVASILVITESNSLLPQGSLRRINSFLEGRYDASAHERVLMRQAAFEAMQDHPFGMGFGGFGRVFNFSNLTDHVHPHNLFLEIAVENGWLVALIFVGLVGLALARGYRTARGSPELQPLFGMFLFAVALLFSSGDVSEEKIFFALFAVSLQLPVRDSEASYTQI